MEYVCIHKNLRPLSDRLFLFQTHILLPLCAGDADLQHFGRYKVGCAHGCVTIVPYEVSADDSNADPIGILFWEPIIEGDPRVSPFVACILCDINLIMCHDKH